jgi:hypothetical protein
LGGLEGVIIRSHVRGGAGREWTAGELHQGGHAVSVHHGPHMVHKWTNLCQRPFVGSDYCSCSSLGTSAPVPARVRQGRPLDFNDRK